MRLPGLPPIPPLTAGPHEDEWGYDPDFARAVEPWLDFLYTRWWRVVADNGFQRDDISLLANDARGEYGRARAVGDTGSTAAETWTVWR